MPFYDKRPMLSSQHGRDDMFRQILFIFSALLLGSCTVDPKRIGMSPQQWQIERQQKIRTSCHGIIQLSPSKTIYNGPNIQVAINKGTVIMPPLLQAYPLKSLKFKMRGGECRYIRLTSWEGKYPVDFQACYDGLTLMLNPSRYNTIKSDGILLLTYNPLWKHGFTYSSLSSAGCIPLNNVTITIRTISQLASVRHVNYSSS